MATGPIDFACALDALGDAVVIAELDGRVIFANAAATRLFACSAEELRGASLAELMPDPLGAPRSIGLERCDGSPRPRIAGHPMRRSVLRRDGVEVPAEISMTAFESGGHTLLAVSLRDERRRAEEALRLIAEASRRFAGSIEVDEVVDAVGAAAVPALADACVVYLASDRGDVRAAASFHADPAKAEILDELVSRFPPRPDAPLGVAAAIRTGEPVLVPRMSEEAMRAVAWDEEHFTLLCRLAPTSLLAAPLGGRGGIVGALAFVTTGRRALLGSLDRTLVEDLASRCALAVENARLHREARAAAQARDAFLVAVAHHLNTPLTPLQLHVEALSRTAVRAGEGLPDAARLAARIHGVSEQVARVTHVARYLFDVAQVIAGRFELAVERLDLAEVVRQSVDRLRPELDQAQCPIDLRLESVWGMWDWRRVGQLVDLLLANAVKFGGEKPVDVEVHAAPSGALLTVRDRGSGIPASFQGRPFASDALPATTELGRFGLGLKMVHEIVRAFGGRVALASEEGRGATFTVLLPTPAEKV